MKNPIIILVAIIFIALVIFSFSSKKENKYLQNNKETALIEGELMDAGTAQEPSYMQEIEIPTFRPTGSFPMSESESE